MVLFLNDISGGEVVLILVFILMFFGSKSIPGLARTMGRTIRQIKDASNDLQAEIKKSANDLKGDLNLTEIIDETARDVRRPLDQYAADIEDAMKRKPVDSVPKPRIVESAPIIPSPEIQSTPVSDIPETSEIPKVQKIEPITPPTPNQEGGSDADLIK